MGLGIIIILITNVVVLAFIIKKVGGDKIETKTDAFFKAINVTGFGLLVGGITSALLYGVTLVIPSVQFHLGFILIITALAELGLTYFGTKE